MRLLIALIFPWFAFFTLGRPIAGILNVSKVEPTVSRLSLSGWLPTAIWAAYAVSQFPTDQKIRRAFGR
ncbi:YqaE/Pmp3 family membrane protein [Stenotrophomonas sp. TWI1149]|uniref:YqaE/Pmp3 family membrane protein n=1 Tax=unclassified Stenotrophomonas TaxID=196198 RepID=UPI00320AAEA2